MIEWVTLIVVFLLFVLGPTMFGISLVIEALWMHDI